MKLAVSGKGGVGKTTLAAILARLYADEGRRVLAVDADPEANLATALGFPAELAGQIVPLVEMADLIEERTGARPGTTGGFFKLNPRVDDLPDRLGVLHHGVRLITMGAVKRGGGGCVCPENVLVKELLRHLVVDRSEVVIADMVAGTEHLGRATAAAVDGLLVVVEPGMRSLGTAATIARLAGDIGIRHVLVVGNKMHGQEEKALVARHLPHLQVLGYLDYSPEAAEADLRGLSPYDLAPQLVEQVQQMKGKLAPAVLS